MNPAPDVDLPDPFPSDPSPSVNDMQNVQPVLAGSKPFDSMVSEGTKELQERRVEHPFLQGITRYFPARKDAVVRAATEGLPAYQDLKEGASTIKFVAGEDLDDTLQQGVDNGLLDQNIADDFSKQAHGTVNDFAYSTAGSITATLASSAFLRMVVRSAPMPVKVGVLGINGAVGVLAAANPLSDLGKLTVFGKEGVDTHRAGIAKSKGVQPPK